jgi:hypothetical protein
MTYEDRGPQAVDCLPCRYGRSKLVFRGPKKAMKGPYVAVLGGSETYGRFHARPYPDLLGDATGVEVVNLGLPNAGIDVFVGEPVIHDLCAGATATVIQVLGAANMSNRFYAVHPRRNDRFLRASPMLKALYPDLDFAELNFTRHLLAAMAEQSAVKFAVVREELREAWVARMKALLMRLPGRKVLLWLSDHPPRDGGDEPMPLGRDPLFVDQDMLAALRSHVADIVTVAVTTDEMQRGREGLIVPDLDVPVAQEMLGTQAHVRAAEALVLHVAPRRA